MDHAERELQAFKQEINLSEYAASLGFTIDRSKSTKSYCVMKRDSETIVITRKENNHYVYFETQSTQDSGTIIDFIKQRQEPNLGRIRALLRQWKGIDGRPATYQKTISPTNKNIQKMTNLFHQFSALTTTNDYLEKDRRINPNTYLHKRFEDRIYIDKTRHQNLVFPQYNRLGLCSYELKNREFRYGSEYGTKGLWKSQFYTSDKHLVFTEHPLDALAYFQIHPSKDTRFIATFGRWLTELDELIAETMERFRGSVVCAFDNDKGGEALTEKLQDLSKKTLKRALPEKNDWNQTLMEDKS